MRSLAEILSTLDERGRLEGLGFMRGAMTPFLGGTFTVRKCINRFFDERGRKMLKVRNVVILDGVFCEPDRRGFHDYAGCERTCFLFWKEAWLERIEPGSSEEGSPGDRTAHHGTLA